MNPWTLVGWLLLGWGVFLTTCLAVGFTWSCIDEGWLALRKARTPARDVSPWMPDTSKFDEEWLP